MVSFINWFGRASATVGMGLLIFMMLFIAVSVCGRYFFSAPIPDDLVIMEAMLVMLVFLPFAFTQEHKAHLSVNLLTNALPRRLRFLCEQFAFVIGIVFMAIVAMASFGDAWGAYQDGAFFEGTLEVPEWPARFSVFVGTGWLFLKLLADFVQGLLAGPAERPEFPAQDEKGL